MLFRQLFDPKSHTFTYLIASDYGREALIIDPVIEQVSFYSRLLEEMQLKLLLSIDTHTHADHITGSGSLHRHLQCGIAMGEQTKAECVTLKLKDGDNLNLDGVSIDVIHTPGHTEDSYSFCMNDRVFTGDTLLIRATGRTDFQEGDPYKQYDSLFNKLLKLPDNTLVYPAHNYAVINASTIGEEKKFNPRLQVRSAEEYANIMNQLNLDKPKLIDVAVPANLNCGLNNE